MERITKKRTLPEKNVAVIWARVSLKGKVDGIKKQVSACKEFVREHGLEVVYTDTMITDGASLNAEQFAKLVQYLAQHPCVNTVLVEGDDKMTRSRLELIMAKCFLHSRGVNLVITQPLGLDSFVDSFAESIVENYIQFENTFCTFNMSQIGERI